MIVFVGNSETTGRPQLWLRPLDQLEPIPIPGTESARSPRFSPDGGSIAFFIPSGLATVSLSGASPRTVVADGVSYRNGLAWGPDGMFYYTTPTGLEIRRVSANGGGEEEIVAGGEAAYRWPDALPDGRSILLTRYVGPPTRNEIAILSLETGEIRTLFRGEMARYAYSGHIVYTSGDGALLAAPFNADRREVTGPSRVLLEGVQVSQNSASQFALSETGVLTYRSGAAARGGELVWVTRSGDVAPVDPEWQFNPPSSNYAWSISPDGGESRAHT